ncbi:MAG TPA: DUF1850 domain-containing protein [Burkholderiaceae bacterium]|nr:DUF1850 domain-containing protein [Burkholderiaceae bacterium]
MIGICLTAATGLALALPLPAFTLAWTHSIEKIRWEEDYRVLSSADRNESGRLQLTEARIRGSGAGMEPPADAVLADGAWHYRPRLAPLQRLRLTRSDYVADYSICWDGQCQPLAALAGSPAAAPLVEVFACEQP